MGSDTNTSPFPLVALLPVHGERVRRHKLSHLVRNDEDATVKIKKSADTNASPFSLLALPAELHLCITDHLAFWDAYALRLTCRHFARITPGLDRNLKTKFGKLIFQLQKKYNQDCIAQITTGELATQDDMNNLCEEFNLSWVARMSNVAYQPCNGDACSCRNCGWSTSPFPLLALPPDLQLRIVEHLPFYAVDALRKTCRHLASTILPIGEIKDEFEELYSQTAAAGGDIDLMCDYFSISWFAINEDVAYNAWGALNKGCGCGRDATSGYSEGCEECGWGESNYDDYDSWTLKY